MQKKKIHCKTNAPTMGRNCVRRLVFTRSRRVANAGLVRMWFCGATWTSSLSFAMAGHDLWPHEDIHAHYSSVRLSMFIHQIVLNHLNPCFVKTNPTCVVQRNSFGSVENWGGSIFHPPIHRSLARTGDRGARKAERTVGSALARKRTCNVGWWSLHQICQLKLVVSCWFNMLQSMPYLMDWNGVDITQAWQIFSWWRTTWETYRIACQMEPPKKWTSVGYI